MCNFQGNFMKMNDSDLNFKQFNKNHIYIQNMPNKF